MRSVLVLCALLGAIGCTDKSGDTGDIDPGTEAAAFTGIEATPATVALGLGQTQAIVVVAEYDDGSTQDVTASATFRVVNSSVVSVSAGGLLTALGEGSTTVEVAYQNQTDVVQVSVGSAALTGAVTFLGFPVQGVEVELSGPFSEAATTDDDGEYRFDGLAAGAYTVTSVFASADRARQPGSDVTVTSSGTATQDLAIVRGAYPTGPDAFEPDNLPGTARPLDVGIVQNHTLWAFPDTVVDGGDRDYFRVSVQAGVEYEVFVTGLYETVDTRVRLYDADGITELDSNDDGFSALDSRLVFTVAAAAERVIRVEAYESESGVGDYFIGVVPVVDADDDGTPAYRDCDDGDAARNLDATEIPGDGIDQDCSGADLPTVDPNEPNNDRSNATPVLLRANSGYELTLDADRPPISGAFAPQARRGVLLDTDWFSVVVPATSRVDVNVDSTSRADVAFFDTDGTTLLSELVNETNAPVTQYITVAGSVGSYVVWAWDVGADEDGDGDYPRDYSDDRDCAEGDPSRGADVCDE